MNFLVVILEERLRPYNFCRPFFFAVFAHIILLDDLDYSSSSRLFARVSLFVRLFVPSSLVRSFFVTFFV